MKIIGITGGVGAGKSEVLSLIKEACDCEILKADELANEIKLKGNQCYDELVKLLGEEVLDDNQEIDKKKMASMIFNDKELLGKINNIIHPAVKKEILRLIDSYRNAGKIDYFFIEAALLIEDGYEAIVDELWYIYASKETRRERLKSSRGYSDEKIENIMNSQLDEMEFREHCKVVINNDKDIEETREQIRRELA